MVKSLRGKRSPVANPNRSHKHHPLGALIRTGWLVWPVMTMTLALTACNGHSVEETAPTAESAPGRGNPARGLQVLLNHTFSRLGLPLAVAVGLRKYAPEMEKMPLVRGRRGFNFFLPAPVTAFDFQDVTVINANCFTCHSGLVDGKYYLGIGNSFMDTSIDIRDTALLDSKKVDRLHLSKKQREAYDIWKESLLTYAEFTVTTSPGTSSAVTFSEYFLSHRSPRTYEWRAEPYVAHEEKVLETDIPPLWFVGKKQGLYFGGEAKGDKVPHIMQFFSAPGNTLADLEAAKGDFRDVLAWMEQLKPPRWPYPISAPLAERGQRVFEQNCADCHGTYGKNASFPDKVVPIHKIGTDPERWNTSRLEGAMEHYNQLWHGQNGSWMEPTPGYVAPPLDGVWVTAPYLHNGSVPTIAALLEDDSLRPRYFIRDSRSRSYDQVNMGWKVEELAHGKAFEADPERRRRIYETDYFGKSNRGHRYGTDLPLDQKVALIEYLKTL